MMGLHQSDQNTQLQFCNIFRVEISFTSSNIVSITFKMTEKVPTDRSIASFSNLFLAPFNRNLGSSLPVSKITRFVLPDTNYVNFQCFSGIKVQLS
jgi:hypothetical protein